MASASSMPSTDQRQDLNSLLECSICLKTFDDPRTLPCLHSFCKKCLENFVDGKCEDELNCPVCHSKFMMNEEEGVAGMTRNHFICNMVEVLSIQHQDKCIPCAHCEQPSVGRCVTCELFMCEKCIQSHDGYIGFRDHLVLTMEELSKPENQSKIKGKSYCKKHSSKKLKLYCETCEELVCTYCMAFEHVRPDHVCSPLEEIAERKREQLKSICNTLEDAYTEFQLDIERILKTCKGNLEKANSEIDERRIEVLRFLQNILEKKTQFLFHEMDKIYNDRIKEINNKVEGQFEEKRKTSNMAKALLEHGSDEEIVLSHRSIQQNATKKYQCLWDDVNVNILPYSSNQLDVLFLDDVRIIEKDTILDKPERVTTRRNRRRPRRPSYRPRRRPANTTDIQCLESIISVDKQDSASCSEHLDKESTKSNSNESPNELENNETKQCLESIISVDKQDSASCSEHLDKESTKKNSNESPNELENNETKLGIHRLPCKQQ